MPYPWPLQEQSRENRDGGERCTKVWTYELIRKLGLVYSRATLNTPYPV